MSTKPKVGDRVSVKRPEVDHAWFTPMDGHTGTVTRVAEQTDGLNTTVRFELPPAGTVPARAASFLYRDDELTIEPPTDA